jgi:hypothetical protein
VRNRTEQPQSAAAGTPTWRREVAIAAGSLAFGVLVLPFAVYMVGERVLGEYAADSGALGLAESIWRDFLSLRVQAWILVLSPYLTLQLVRAARRVWRPKL